MARMRSPEEIRAYLKKLSEAKGKLSAYEYTDEDKKEVWYRLFFDDWGIYMQQIDIYSEEHLEVFGYRGDLDNWSNEKVYVRKSIVEMAAMAEQGIPFQITDFRKTSVMYDLIMEHLSYWSDRLETSISRIAPPLDDLVALNNLAHKLMPTARQYIKREEISTGMGFFDMVWNFKHEMGETTKAESNLDLEHSNSDINKIASKLTQGFDTFYQND